MQKVDADINNTRIQLGETRNVIIHKDAEIDKCKMEIIKVSENSTSDGCLEMEHKLEYEKEGNKDLVKKLADQIIITEKTELAFNTQNELVNAKNEIIENHKLIIEQFKKEAFASDREVTQNLTSDMANGCIGNSNGVQDCCDFIKLHTKHGVILNGLLLWADIQRKVSPENIWKEKAVKRFDNEEITESKQLLWRTAGDSILGKMVKRQGANKSLSECNDICHALTSLSEKDSLPMFLCTGNMVAQTPIYIAAQDKNVSSEVINTQLKTIQESINYILSCEKKMIEPRMNRLK